MKKHLISLVISFVLIISQGAVALADSSLASAVICADTGEILYEKNSSARLPMASTTKIMTALLLCEYGNLEKEITVTEEMVRVEGSSMGLVAGDRVTLKALLYGMMLPSGNDAANVTAFTVGGSVKGFVELMNKKADALGLKNTHFETPSGLDGENHYTTAYELAILSRYALKNPDFAKAAGSETAVVGFGNPPYLRRLTNHNRLLRTYGDVIGVKTGFTKMSGRCLVSAARRDNKTVIAVTLNDKNDWADHRELLDLGLSLVNTEVFYPKTKTESIKVLSGEREEIKLSLPETQITFRDKGKIKCKINLKPFVYAPVKKGEALGRVEYYFGNTLIKTENIAASENIRQIKINEKAKLLSIIKTIITKI